MTWKSFFDISTMEHRHLLITYIGVWVVQLGYLGSLLWRWRKAERL